MSLWTNIRDIGETVLSGGAALAVNDSAANKAGGLVNAITGRPSAAEKRTQQYAVNDQIRAYKEQTELSNQQIKAAQDEKTVEKRKVNEKQIRSLRNNFRPAGGFLNNQNASSPSSLGNSGTLPTKLGNA
jgi:hypothetical protein